MVPRCPSLGFLGPTVVGPEQLLFCSAVMIHDARVPPGRAPCVASESTPFSVLQCTRPREPEGTLRGTQGKL